MVEVEVVVGRRVGQGICVREGGGRIIEVVDVDRSEHGVVVGGGGRELDRVSRRGRRRRWRQVESVTVRSGGDGGHRVAFIALTNACRQVAGHDVGIGGRGEGREEWKDSCQQRMLIGRGTDEGQGSNDPRAGRLQGIIVSSFVVEVEEPNETTRIRAINRRPHGTSAALRSVPDRTTTRRGRAAFWNQAALLLFSPTSLHEANA